MKTRLPHAMKIRFLIGVALCLVQGAIVNAQVLDTRFRAPLVTQRTYFEDVAELSDRKLIVAMGGGGNSYYYGTKQLESNLVKLSSSGLMDNTFKTDFWGYAERVIEHKAGSIFVIDGWDDEALVLLSRAGRVTKYFELYNVYTVCVLPDYSFLVSTGDALVKYKANLTVDTSFGVDGWVTLNEDAEVNDIKYFGGKFYIAGDFWWVGDTEVNDVARLNANGSVDTSFDPGWGADEEIGSITIQPDGKILLGNTDNQWFDDEYFGGSIIRLNNDGSIDWDFESRSFSEIGDVFYASGKILAADADWQEIYRLELDGSDDETFLPIEFATWDGDFDVFQLKTTDFLISNTYSEEELEYGLRKYKRNGQRVSSFRPPLTEQGWIEDFVPVGQKILISGEFQWVNGQPRYNIARLSNTGTLDASFKTEEFGGLRHMTVLEDGSIVGVSDWYGQLFKLNSNGSINEDFNFQWGPFYYWSIQEIKAVPGGGFALRYYYSYNAKLGFAVRTANGDFVDGFEDVETDVFYYTYGDQTHDIAVQSDGKIIYGSPATTYNGIGGYQLVTRFNTDGTVDNTFNVGSAYNQLYLRHITVLKDGGLFLEGNFNQFNSWNVNGAVKLSSDGSVDGDFLSNYANAGYDYGNYSYPTISFRNGTAKWAYSNQTGWGMQLMNYDGTSAGMLSIPNLYLGWQPGYSAGDDKALYLYNVGYDIQVNGINKSAVKISYPTLKPLPVQQPSNPARVAQSATYEVFPNPTVDFIAFDTDKPAKVSIVTMDGNVRVESMVKNGNDQIDVRNLQPGRYVIKMVVDGEIRTSHFIRK